MIEYKTLLVEKPIECPMCMKELSIGDILYQDDYRGEILCGYCKEGYEDEVLLNEGEDGMLLN